MTQQKTIYLPPSFDSDAYVQHRIDNDNRHINDAVKNGVGNFAGFGGPSGMGQVNPFNLPMSSANGSTQMLSNANTIFNNLRWYFVSNFRQMLSEAYVELGLVQTIVDVPVDDAFRGGIEIKTKQLSPEQVEELQISLDRDDDLNTVAQTAKWNRLFGGAGTLILTDQDPRTPLNLNEITEDTPLEFRAVDLWELFWDRQNTEGYDPAIQTQEFEFYNYYGEIVHKSRVMRMKGKTAPSFVRPRLRGWGFSEVEKLVRSINQYLKATDLAFEVLDEFKLDIYRIKNLVNTLLSPQGANKVKQRIAVANQIKNYQNAIVMDVEDEYEQKQLSFSGLAETMGQIRMQVASDMRIPMTKLFGISAAGFNSGEDDIEVYNAMVESEVRNKVKYQVLRVLEIKCQKLFGMIPDDLSITFKPLRIMSGVDEETIKTSKFNRLLQARQTNEITPEQFVDACNKGQLFDIPLDKVDMLLPEEYDEAKETEARDPNDPQDVSDPGANRADVRYPKARDKGGMAKGLKKGDHPFGDKDTKAPGRATNPDDPSSEETQRKSKGGRLDWVDEPMPEEEMDDHELKLEKSKSEESKDDAPEPKKPKTAKPTTGKTEKTGDAKKPEEKRRINNGKIMLEKERQYRLLENKLIGLVPAYKNPKTGKVSTGQDHMEAYLAGHPGYDVDSSGYFLDEDDKRVDKANKLDGTGPDFGFRMKDGTFINKKQADKLQEDLDKYWRQDNSKTQVAIDVRTKAGQPGIVIKKNKGQFPETSTGDRKSIFATPPGGFDPFDVEDADLVRQPGTNYRQPDDRIVDDRKDNDPQHPQKPFLKKRCASIAVIADGYILTGKRRDTALWTSPGGHVADGETLRDGAVRELAEETGIQVGVTDLQPLTAKTFTYPDHSTHVQVFRVDLSGRVLARTINDPDEEIERWRWVPLNKSSIELKSWNRQADEDLVIKSLLGENK